MTKNLNASFKLANTLFVCITVFIVMAIFNETFLIYANSLLLFKQTNTLLIDYTTLIMRIAIIIRIKKIFVKIYTSKIAAYDFFFKPHWHSLLLYLCARASRNWSQSRRLLFVCCP